MSLGLAGVYIIFLMFIPLCLWGMHKEPEHNGDISLMSMDDSNYLKGVSACGVFLAHSYNYLHTNNISNINLLIPFSLLGGMGVLMFLFTGGYGIYKSFEKTNKMQLKSYWYKRLTNVYIPAVIINAIIAVAICAVQNDWSITQIAITGFFGGWYINVVMLEYLSFCIAALITRDKKKILMLMLIFNLALFVLFTYLDLDARWRNGLFVYPFGIFVASYEEKLRKILLKKWKSIFAINATIFVFGGGIFTYYKGTLGADIMKNIAGCALAMICLCIFENWKMGNRIIYEIGKRSLYIYLIHLGVLQIIENGKKLYSVEPAWNVVVLLVSSVILTEIAYRIHNVITRGFLRIKI